MPTGIYDRQPCPPGCTCGRHARKTHPNKLARNRAWRAANADKVRVGHRAWYLLDQYGITVDEYEIILAYQEGKCAVCLTPPKEGGKRLSVDHDHRTGYTRGLLCWTCNAAIGKFRDNRDHLIRAAEYISNPPVTAALGRDVYGRVGRVDRKHTRQRRSRSAK